MWVKTFATVTLLALLVTTRAFAERPLKATIPFDFAVSTTQMPAGEYTVTFDHAGTVQIAREDRSATVSVITNSVHARTVPTMGSLVFNKYADSYFLAQIWSPGYENGRELRKSKRELEMARNGAPVRRAAVPAATQ